MLWGNPNPPRRTVGELFRATPGSAGLDLSSSIYTVLTPEMGMQALATGVYGPLPNGTVGLLLGRGSTTMKGLLVAPGVIDADFTGEIKVMAHSPRGITVIEPGHRIAQIILLPLCKAGQQLHKGNRGIQGFGSSDAFWVQEVKKERPQMELIIQGKRFLGLLDTGADVSVIALQHWPKTWPKQAAATSLQGIGQSAGPEQSSALLQWRDHEGHQGVFQPYILPHLPLNLWGRDIMSQMGVQLYCPQEIVLEKQKEHF